MRVRSRGREEHPPGGGQGNPPQYSCLENPHRQRRLAGCSPWGSPRLGRSTLKSRAMLRNTVLGYVEASGRDHWQDLGKLHI